MNHNDKTWSFSRNVPLNAEASGDNFPWSIIDGIQIHEDSDGHLFTFFDLLASQELDRQVKAVRQQAQESLHLLRTYFTLEFDLRDTHAPPTWDGMNELFRLWLNDRLQEDEANVAPETKAEYARLAEDEA